MIDALPGEGFEITTNDMSTKSNNTYIEFVCACGKQLRTKSGNAGRNFKCSQCGREQLVPKLREITTEYHVPVPRNETAFVPLEVIPTTSARIGITAGVIGPVASIAGFMILMGAEDQLVKGYASVPLVIGILFLSLAGLLLYRKDNLLYLVAFSIRHAILRVIIGVIWLSFVLSLELAIWGGISTGWLEGKLASILGLFGIALIGFAWMLVSVTCGSRYYARKLMEYVEEHFSD